jgi:lipooligosaccharide transport system ATP-binding protein
MPSRNTSEPVITGRNLVKRYGDNLAVDDFDLTVHRRKCFGLLGPNGAGKTSTLKMASYVSPVTSGKLLIEDKSVTTDQRGVKALPGVVPKKENIDTDLTVLENLTTYAGYYDMCSTTALARARGALFLFQP